MSIEVRDSGVGLTDEQVETINAETAWTPSAASHSGLGSHIVRQVVQARPGTLTPARVPTQASAGVRASVCGQPAQTGRVATSAATATSTLSRADQRGGCAQVRAPASANPRAPIATASRPERRSVCTSRAKVSAA
ncbi:MAG: ATP-binding protein, partial [Cellulomonas sp.]|nr:ATP-binding protein [Cellulomonas sp.]